MALVSFVNGYSAIRFKDAFYPRGLFLPPLLSFIVSKTLQRPLHLVSYYLPVALPTVPVSNTSQVITSGSPFGFFTNNLELNKGQEKVRKCNRVGGRRRLIVKCG
jgi:hypothetical protein